MTDNNASAPPRRKRGRATDVDVLVGKHIRNRRMLLGMSQSELAGALGITFQQLQKYERGLNRVGAGRLYEVSRALQAPVSYFFSGTEEREEASLGLDDEANSRFSQRETVELVRAYYTVRDRSVRRRLLDLIRAIGGAEGQPELANGELGSRH